jgi:hypothetical protein
MPPSEDMHLSMIYNTVGIDTYKVTYP